MLSATLLGASIAAAVGQKCQFSHEFKCDDFFDEVNADLYMSNVMTWEGKFAVPGIGYDSATGHTYDGHPLDYDTGELYGEPHMFSAPSKESIHLSILSLAIRWDILV